MIIYEAKILTEESKIARCFFIKEMLKGKDFKPGSIEYVFEYGQWEMSLNFMNNGKGEKLKDAIELELTDNLTLTKEEHMALILVIRPECHVKEFKDERSGLQSHARILWDDEIKKIEDIDDIISFKILE